MSKGRGSKRTRDYIRQAGTTELQETLKALQNVQNDRRNGRSGSIVSKQITDKVIILRIGDIKKELQRREQVANEFKGAKQ